MTGWLHPSRMRKKTVLVVLVPAQAVGVVDDEAEFVAAGSAAVAPR